MGFGPAGLLLLGEPANHLSPALAKGLERALGSFGGTVVLAGSDRALRSGFAGRRIQPDRGEDRSVAGTIVKHRGRHGRVGPSLPGPHRGVQ